MNMNSIYQSCKYLETDFLKLLFQKNKNNPYGIITHILNWLNDIGTKTETVSNLV